MGASGYSAGFVFGATIGGGGQNTISNLAAYGVIAGGSGNSIASTGISGVIGGGTANEVSGSGGVVPGGFGNLAGGIQSFAAGTDAQATNDGSFVLTDGETTNFYSTTTNQLSARFNGGIRLVTAGAGVTLDGQPILAGKNGGILTNINATTLNGQPSTAYAAASGSANYIQNQSASQQSASFNINGNATVGNTVTANTLIASTAQVTGLFRSGSETGTANPPSPAGLVIRRLNSTSATVSNVVARTDVLTLERDGSNEGLLIRYPAGVARLTINCLAQSFYGTNIIVHATLNNQLSAGTIQLLTSAQHAVHAEISFGNTFSASHLTRVSIDRYDDGTVSDYYWMGTLTSTYNQ